MIVTTLDGLREVLDDLADEGFPGDTKLFVAFQPTYPLYGALQVVYPVRHAKDEQPEIYLAGTATGYLPEEIAHNARAEGWQ